jgi:hypothetical protein
MIDDISMKAFLGESLSLKEQEELTERNFRYELVRFLYVEKMKSLGIPINNFHFTPSDGWMEVPVYDIITNLIDAIMSDSVEQVNGNELYYNE